MILFAHIQKKLKKLSAISTYLEANLLTHHVPLHRERGLTRPP